MAQTVINIEGAKYPIKFGYGAFRIMGKKWKCKGINETMQRLSQLDGIDENLSFDQEDIIADMVLSGIECAGATDVPSQDQVLEAVLANPEVLTQITADLMDSFPRAARSPSGAEGKKKVVNPKKK